MKIYRLTFSLPAAPDAQFYSGKTADAREIVSLGAQLQAVTAHIFVQVLTVDGDINYQVSLRSFRDAQDIVGC